LGGRAITPGAVDRLLARLEKEIPSIEMREAALDAAVYSHVYPSPVPDEQAPANDLLTGARFTGQYPVGALGVRPVDFPNPEPGENRDPVGAHDIVDRDGEEAVMPIPSAMRWVRPNDAAATRVEEAVWEIIERDDEYDPNNIVYRSFQIVHNVMELRVARRGIGIINPRWRHAFGDEWVSFFGLQELVDAGEVTLEDAESVFLSGFSPEEAHAPMPPNNELVGDYTAYRNLFQAVDSAQRLNFPAYDMVHVAGVLAGLFHVKGMRGGGVTRVASNNFVAMHGVATNFAHFWSRAVTLRKVDPQLLLRELRQGGNMVLGMPYGYQSVVYPDVLEREAYPWGSWEHLEVAPLIASVNNSDSFVGFGFVGNAVGDEKQGWLSVLDSDIQFVDAWVRAVASAIGTVPLLTPTTTTARFVYHLLGQDRFAHPFCTPMRVVRRAGARANLLAVGPALEEMRIQTSGVFPFDPFISPAPSYVARRVL